MGFERSGLEMPSVGGVASQVTEPDWAQLGMSAGQSGIIAGDAILFDTVINGNGTIAPNASGVFTLKAGKSYEVNIDLGASFGGTAGRLAYRLYDITNAAYLIGRGTSVPPTSSSGVLYGPIGHVGGMFTVGAADIQCEVRATVVTNVTTTIRDYGISAVLIREIPDPATSAVSDPGTADGQMLSWDSAAQKWVAGNPGGLITTKSADHTITDTDAIYTLLMDASGAPRTVNLPAAANNPNRVINVKKIDSSANAVTAAGNGADLIDGGATAAITPQWQSLTFHCDGSNWYII